MALETSDQEGLPFDQILPQLAGLLGVDNSVIADFFANIQLYVDAVFSIVEDNDVIVLVEEYSPGNEGPTRQYQFSKEAIKRYVRFSPGH